MKNIFFILGGLVCIGCILVFSRHMNISPINQNMQKKEWHIAPLFSAEDARYYGNWLEAEYDKVVSAQHFYNTAFGCNNIYARNFITEVELYLIANRHLASLPESEKQKFYDSYQQWLAEHKKKCSAPLLDENGEKLEGTMTAEMYAGRRLDNIEEYLTTFKERTPLKYDFRKEVKEK